MPNTQTLATPSLRDIPVHWMNDPSAENKTNYQLKAGDIVELREHATVDGYWFDETIMSRGSWDSHVILAGSQGTVVAARTPFVHSRKGRTRYFANIDIPHAGGVSRVRVAHSALRRLSPRELAKLA